jgi:hypothetical protein
MKNIKKIIFFSFILFLTGCSVDYKLTINKDSTINEKVVAKENTNRMKSKTNLDEKQSVTFLTNIYNRNKLDIKTSTKSDNYNTEVTAFLSYDSIEKYRDNFSSDVIKKVKVTRDGDIVTLIAKQNVKLDSNASRSLIYDDITVQIEVPFVVIDNNADQVDGNIYTWYIKKDKDIKTIRIKYKDKEIKNSIKINVKNKDINIKYEVIFSAVIVLFLGFIFIILNYKNKKNNRI